MNKRILITLFFLFQIAGSFSQNVQILYDFGKQIYSSQADRANITITYEHYSEDAFGSWFQFVDFDIKKEGAFSSYTELSRTFKIKDSLPELQIEYNGGLNEYGSFANSFLAGVTSRISKVFSISLLYKVELKQKELPLSSTVQLTSVWDYSIGKMSFCGFVDVWRSYIPKWNGSKQEKGWIVLAEPQLWYNVNNTIAVGTEIRVSYNFIYPTEGHRTMFINPAITVKYNLK